MDELKIGEIIKERYKLVQFLGNGSFGEVWLAHDQFNGQEVALKIYMTLDPAGVEEFQREYANTIDLSSPFLLTPRYFDVYGRRPFLVMKYCENGSASKLAGNITEDRLWQFIHDVASGLAVLHTQSDPIVHQDIKPDNILIDSDGRFVITDFGISKRLRATMRRQSRRDVSSGAMPYMAPERFESTPHLTTSSDIWSLGASIYELATGELPFSGFGGAMQKNGAELPSLPAEYTPGLNALMQCCLNPCSGDRPSAVELAKWATSRELPGNRMVNSHDTLPKRPANINDVSDREKSEISSTSSSDSNIWKPISILAILAIVGILIYSAVSVGNSDSSDRNIAEAVDVDTVSGTMQYYEPVAEFADSVVDSVADSGYYNRMIMTAEDEIIHSYSVVRDGQEVHYYKGAFYYGNDVYPVMVAFIEGNGRIQNVVYKNMTYGGRIVMGYQSVGDNVRLSGIDGNNNFVMMLSAGEDNRLLGTAVDGNKSMTVRLMPTSESFILP